MLEGLDSNINKMWKQNRNLCKLGYVCIENVEIAYYLVKTVMPKCVCHRQNLANHSKFKSYYCLYVYKYQ